MQVNSISSNLFSSSWTSQYIQAGRESLGKTTKSDLYQPSYDEPLTSKEVGLEVIKASTPNYNFQSNGPSQALTKDEVGLELVKMSAKSSVAQYEGKQKDDKNSVSQCLRKRYI